MKESIKTMLSKRFPQNTAVGGDGKIRQMPQLDFMGEGFTKIKLLSNT